jgi:hypothetical protein
MSECPKCGSEVGNAGYCGCGWKRKAIVKGGDKPPEQTVKCCHDICFNDAKVKIKTHTGWANLCMRHYDDHYQKQSEEYCNALGLTTTEQRRAWVKQQINRLAKKYTRYVPKSEPGADYEEDAA